MHEELCIIIENHTLQKNVTSLLDMLLLGSRREKSEPSESSTGDGKLIILSYTKIDSHSIFLTLSHVFKHGCHLK